MRQTIPRRVLAVFAVQLLLVGAGFGLLLHQARQEDAAKDRARALDRTHVQQLRNHQIRPKVTPIPGLTGQTGDTGLRGPRGPVGITGRPGREGQSVIGPTGPPGDAVVGPAGAAGPPGATVTGPPGADSTVPGPSGSPGAEGSPGPDCPEWRDDLLNPGYQICTRPSSTPTP